MYDRSAWGARRAPQALLSCPWLFSWRGTHDEGVDLVDLAPPVRDLDLVAGAHDGHVAHMGVAVDNGQSLRPDLRLIGRGHQRRVILAQGIGRVGVSLAMQLLVEVNIELRVEGR